MKIFIMFVIFIIAVSFIMGYLHEQVHVAIYSQYGINSTVYYFKYFPYFVTIPDKECPDSNCILVNSLNESISYNILAVFLILAGGFLSVIRLLEISNEDGAGRDNKIPYIQKR
jgi:hypothetical protein